MLLLRAPMATTGIIPTLAPPTDTMDRRGLTAVSLSEPARGIGATATDTAAAMAIAAAMAMAMDDRVTGMHVLVMVAATAVTWAAAASMVAAAAVGSMAAVAVGSMAAVAVGSMAAVAVDSTVAVATAVADTGNSSGVDQTKRLQDSSTLQPLLLFT
jgi:hypothetical protein